MPGTKELRRRARLPSWRRDALRSSLWLVPAVLVGAAVVLFAVTYGIDQAASRGDLTLPSWINQGGADASRQILSAIAAADITVVIYHVGERRLEKVTANFALRKGELNEAKTDAIVKALSAVLPQDKR